MRVTFEDVDYDSDQLLTYHDVPYTGEVASIAPGGRPLALRRYRDGSLDGLSVRYDDAGTLIAEEYYRLGIPTGTHREWYSNGQMRSELTFDQLGRVVR